MEDFPRDDSIQLLDPRTLRPHEKVRFPHALMVLLDIFLDRKIKQPILVDIRNGVILDGHHRWWASKRLGLALIPCYCVDYLNDGQVICESWRAGIFINKERVLAMAASGKTFPPQTSKHTYYLPTCEPFSLRSLRRGSVKRAEDE